MKKRVVFFVVLAMVLVGFCAAQSASNYAQQIVGTWTTESGVVWVFNANGTGSRGDQNFNYGISVDGIICTSIDMGGGSNTATICLSPDCKKMILDNKYRTVFLQKK